jgi:hypothetical protein
MARRVGNTEDRTVSYPSMKTLVRQGFDIRNFALTNPAKALSIIRGLAAGKVEAAPEDKAAASRTGTGIGNKTTMARRNLQHGAHD